MSTPAIMRNFGPRRSACIFVLLISILVFIDASVVVVPASGSVGSLPGRIVLLTEAEKILASVKSTRYQHETYVDETNGTYYFDCSGFVDYSLQQVLPESLSVIQFSPNPFDRPRAKDYYNHFISLGPGENPGGWYRVDKPTDLVPGDVIAWLISPGSDSDDTGHVMVVRLYPTVDKNRPNELDVTIIDSTGSPHANDSRANGMTGVGTGTISLVTNADGNAIGFRWRDGQSTHIDYTKIAFGELGAIYSTLNSSTSAIYGTVNSSSDQVLLPIIAAVILVCVVVSLIRIRKLRSSKSCVCAPANSHTINPAP
jgi:hypothetical protein